MKKILIILLFCVVATCLCGCSLLTPQTPDKYEIMNKAVKADYSKVNLKVETVKDGEKLTSTFEATKQADTWAVEYSVEQFAEISSTQLPTEYKKTYSGTVQVKDGAIISNDSDLPVADFDFATSVGVKFNAIYFENATFQDGTFTADVIIPAAFMGDNSFQCEEMFVKFVYANTSKPSLTITYNENGGEVTLTYTLG